MSLNQFPIRDGNSELSTRAEAAFEQAIAHAAHFVVQRSDRHDYGTDFQLEASLCGGMTNFRVHVQLKATDKQANVDGSVSIPVARTNLNYMLSQPHSVYVCYHAPTQRLLVRSAEDVYKDAEHEGEGWRSQEHITVRLRASFDAPFQSMHHARTIASSTAQRDERLQWISARPLEYAESLCAQIPTIVVPESPDDAFEALTSLYNCGRDEVISKAFDQFSACFEPDDTRLIYAYLAEINLAMRGQPYCRSRVSAAIEFIRATRPDNSADVLYCLANGHGALGDNDVSKRLYREAIQKADAVPHLAAQCWKNLGTVLEQEGDHPEARNCYESALALSPDLVQAHMALAMSNRDAGSLDLALAHFDHVVWAVDDVAVTLAARGHRLELYFRLGMSDKAFDDIAVIMPHGTRHPWVTGWCALQVYNYARTAGSSVLRAIRFWDAYLRLRPKDRYANKERLLCLAYAKMHGQAVAIGYRQYIAEVSAHLESDATDAAQLWDRAGHWAQSDKDWEQAEKQYRKAYSLEPERYGYCLGTALCSLNRFDEALPLLLEQATVHQVNAMSWFQVAIAQEGTGNIDECKAAYRRALELEPSYELAMFNLGGVCWNHGDREEALRVWRSALQSFPSHPLAHKLVSDFPELVPSFDDEA